MSTNESRPPMVSVIATSYNQERWVLDTLESIKRQELQDFEIIYADDASSDGSVRLATSWLQSHPFPFRTLIQAQNQGLCRTLNEAIALSRGTYVKMIACDDVLHPQMLAAGAAALSKSSSDVMMACTNFRLIDENGLVLKEQYFDKEYRFPEDVFSALLTTHTGYVVCTPTVMMRREVFNKVGSFDESLRREDLDMLLRISQRFGVCYVADPLVDYRCVSTSLSRHPRHRVPILRENLTVLDRFAETGARAEALVEKRKHDLQLLMALATADGLWSDVEFCARELAQLPEGGQIGWILGRMFSKDVNVTRRLATEYRLSSGNLVKDWVFRFGDRRLYELLRRARDRIRLARRSKESTRGW